MNIIRTLLLCLLLPGVGHAGYKIPSLDDRESSPPVISGEVLEIIGNILVVESRGEKVSVLTNSDTHIFSVYGGLVFLNEICERSNIAIWYHSPEANFRIASAVSIRVPSTC